MKKEYIWTAHPPQILPSRQSSKAGIVKQHCVKCRDMANMLLVSRRLCKEFVVIKPNLSIILARGGLPLGISLVLRLQAAGHCKYLKGGKNFHIFPGIVKKNWPRLKTNSVSFFRSEMMPLVSNIKDVPVKIFISDTTYSGNAINLLISNLDFIASACKKKVHVFLRPVIDRKNNPKKQKAKTWNVDDCVVIRPHSLTAREYRDIVGQTVQISDFLWVNLKYQIVPNLFTEDYKELLGGALVPGWPALGPVKDGGCFVFESDSGIFPAGSAGADGVSSRLPYYFAEIGPIKLRDWRLWAKQKASGPAQMSDIVELLSQPSYPDKEYENMILNSPRYTGAQIYWLGRYGQSPIGIKKLSKQLGIISDSETKENAVFYMRKMLPDLAMAEPKSEIDVIFQWWTNKLNPV